MGSRVQKDLKLILHPYVFVLKEGQKIGEDFLDYSLLILQVGRPEMIRSPKGSKGISEYSETQTKIGFGLRENSGD